MRSQLTVEQGDNGCDRIVEE